MRLPDFLGLGAERSGTTWLHGVLAGHPDVFMPRHRKEIGFFDMHYDRGVEWYARFFAAAHPGQIVGEITPSYIANEVVAQRIETVLPDCRFLLIVRNPVDRVFSTYKYRMRATGGPMSFAEFVRTSPGVIRRSKYAAALRPFLERFGRDRFLIVIFEQAIGCPDSLYQDLAAFLEVPASGFGHVVEERNQAYPVRWPLVYRRLRHLGKSLRHLGLDAVVEQCKRWGIPKVFRASAESLPDRDGETSSVVWRAVERDVDEFEKLVGCDCSIWRPSAR